MCVLCTNDSILAGPDKAETNQIIKEMQKVKLNITVEGDLEDFLGINVDRRKDGATNLTQPHLIDQICASKTKTSLPKTPQHPRQRCCGVTRIQNCSMDLLIIDP
jgi:hypothetical protein